MLHRAFRVHDTASTAATLVTAIVGVSLGAIAITGCSESKTPTAADSQDQAPEPTEIANLEYDEAKYTLVITLHNQTKYHYNKVIPMIYNRLKDSSRPRDFYEEYIRGQCPLQSYSVPDGIEVESEDFDRITFDPNSNLLFIQFDWHATYAYWDFPREEFDGLQAASVKRRYFSDHIRGKYGSHRL